MKQKHLLLQALTLCLAVLLLSAPGAAARNSRSSARAHEGCSTGNACGLPTVLYTVSFGTSSLWTQTLSPFGIAYDPAYRKLPAFLDLQMAFRVGGLDYLGFVLKTGNVMTADLPALELNDTYSDIRFGLTWQNYLYKSPRFEVINSLNLVAINGIHSLTPYAGGPVGTVSAWGGGLEEEFQFIRRFGTIGIGFKTGFSAGLMAPWKARSAGLPSVSTPVSGKANVRGQWEWNFGLVLAF